MKKILTKLKNINVVKKKKTKNLPILTLLYLKALIETKRSIVWIIIKNFKNKIFFIHRYVFFLTKASLFGMGVEYLYSSYFKSDISYYQITTNWSKIFDPRFLKLKIVDTDIFIEKFEKKKHIFLPTHDLKNLKIKTLRLELALYTSYQKECNKNIFD
jgi:hypothetical protein